MRRSGGALLAVTLVAVAAVGGSASAADKIKIGFFSTLEGPYTALGEDGQRGFDLALMQHKNKAGGKDLEIVRGSSDASPNSALRAAKKARRTRSGGTFFSHLCPDRKVLRSATTPRPSRKSPSSTVAPGPWKRPT